MPRISALSLAAAAGLFAARGSAEPSAPRSTGPTESVAAESTAPHYQFGAFVRVRYQQSAVTVVPRLRSLIQSHYPDPTVAAAAEQTVRDTARESDGIYPARADVTLSARATSRLHGELRMDFARLLNGEETSDAVREFYGEYTAAPELSVMAGIFAAPFSLHELFEAREFELAKEGPSHQLLEHLRFYGREVGAMLRIKPLWGEPKLRIDLSALDGGATGAQAYRGPGLFAARVTGTPTSYLALEAGASYRPRPVEKWWEELRYRYRAYDRGLAVEANASLELSPFTLRSEWLMGRRVDNDIPIPLALRRGDARTFMALFAMATVRLPLGSVFVTPAVRGEWLDVDREHAGVGQIIHLSAGFNVDFDDNFRALCELSRHLVEPGTRNWSFEILRYDTDATIGTLQLQMAL